MEVTELMAADRVYKRLDYDQIDYMIYYMFTKLKNSPLTSNTTYTIKKDGEYIVLIDSFGTVVSRIHDDNTTYEEANSTYAGLLSSTLYTKLNGIEAHAEVNIISSASVNGVELEVTDGNINILVPTNADIETIVESYGYQTADQVNAIIDEKAVGLYDLKGSVENYSDLPIDGVKKGDAYNVINSFTIDGPQPKTYPEGTNVVWDGNEWDPLGGSFDSSAYVKITDTSSLSTAQITTAVNNAYTEVFGS